jgi:hypothetical protein
MNPTAAEVRDLIAACPNKCARRITDTRTGDVWVWPHHQATHAEGARMLGVPYAIAPGQGEVLVDD